MIEISLLQSTSVFFSYFVHFMLLLYIFNVFVVVLCIKHAQNIEPYFFHILYTLRGCYTSLMRLWYFYFADSNTGNVQNMKRYHILYIP